MCDTVSNPSPLNVTYYLNKVFPFKILGGTLGLFVGMSIMTGIEIFMWLLQFLYKVMLLGKKSTAGKKIQKKKNVN